MGKLFLFIFSLIVTVSANARGETVTFKCEKDVTLIIDRLNRQAIVNGEVLRPNRTQRLTIGQDSKGNRYEFGYTDKPRLRSLTIFEPMLNRQKENLYCHELSAK